MGCHCILDVEGAKTTIVDPKVSNQSPLDGHIGALCVCVRACVCVCVRACVCVCVCVCCDCVRSVPSPSTPHRAVKRCQKVFHV